MSESSILPAEKKEKNREREKNYPESPCYYYRCVKQQYTRVTFLRLDPKYY